MGKKKLRYLLIAIAIVLAVLIVKAVLFFTAEPKVTVDYVAELNRMSRPANYDPNDNAAPYYQKAFDAFVEMPDESWNPYINWPADFNGTEQTLLERWLASNSQTFEYFRIAANKPYYWLERQAKEGDFTFDIMFSELAPLRELTLATGWNAKLNATKGRFQQAFENILNCYRAGRQKCRTPSCLIEQHIGMSFKKTAVRDALVILDRIPVDSSSLKFFQGALQTEFYSDTYTPDFMAEKLFLYDALQRTFIDNGRGTGRLSWRAANGLTAMCCEWHNFRIYLSCLVGPTRNQVAEQIEQVSNMCAQLKYQTPWQLKNQNVDYFEKIGAINNSNFLLSIVGISPKGTFHLYHKIKTQTEVLIAIVAILRFKADTGQFPESLDKLVSTAYLQSIPMDPYSNKPLVYKVTDGNFKLYSVGEDFEDNGGVIEIVNMSRQERGFRGTSIIPYVHSPDIVYWPVKDLMKLRYEFTFEETERLKVEKEAEAQKKIEEANQPE